MRGIRVPQGPARRRLPILLLIVAAAGGALVAWDDGLRTHLLGAPLDPCAAPTETVPRLVLEPVTNRLVRPVHMTTAGDGSGRLFVVEQPGRIQILKDGRILEKPFLDIRPKVTFGGETGLLSVAFHPRYRENGRFFVNYTATEGGQLKSVIAEYQASRDPNVAETRERVLLQVDQPFVNHNGGLNLFGPDGMLYIGFGDGGSAGDPSNNAQSLRTLLGKVLRIDVGGTPYAVPPDNPFRNREGARDEIWAYGLRNPWRFSFDRCTRRLFLSDAGQNRWEEIDVVEAGKNYGWRIMEGRHCFNPPVGCQQAGLELPIAEYPTSAGCVVIGGAVYRGRRHRNLIGRYVFGDYCSGQLWLLTESQPGTWTMRESLSTGLRITSFGEDEEGELYVVDHGGTIARLAVK